MQHGEGIGGCGGQVTRLRSACGDEPERQEFTEPVLGSRICIREVDDVNGWAVDFRLQKQRLLERAKHQEERARRQKNAQAQDIMRALAALYREMANELEEGSVIPNYMH